MSQRSTQISRKTLAIKRTGGDPLTRADLQYDLLYNIFHDDHAVFTDPHQSINGSPAVTKVCFRDLYINTIMRSPKATKVLREKMQDVPDFATDFAMLALLTNVGRVNTTMSFFPEMKTAIRTYHPVPALQRTNGNLQDAPRIKHILKACTLDSERKNVPSTPSDILARAKAGRIPSTSVTNLIFVMANHSVPLGQAHFSDGLEFLDLFIPINQSSASRARAFLWLCYHYLEGPSADNDDDYDSGGSSNPFSDQHRGTGRIPPLITLSPEEAAKENQDTEEEKQLGIKLVNQRLLIQKSHGSKGPGIHVEGALEDDDVASIASETKPKGKRGGAPSVKSAAAKEKKAVADKLRRERLKKAKMEREMLANMVGPGVDVDPDDTFLPEVPVTQNQYPQPVYHYPQMGQSPPLLPQSNVRNSSATPEPPPSLYLQHSSVKSSSIYKRSSQYYPLQRVPSRTMLQQAWHVITHSDPLIDSDEEFADEHVRQDYAQRVHILNRLRPRSPSPATFRPADMEVDEEPRFNTTVYGP